MSTSLFHDRAEWVNMLTHAIGCALSVAGLVVLVVKAGLWGGARDVVACSIYGASLVLLYLASTLYHGSRNPRVKRAMRILDHASIYLLIAGTYTPFALVSLGGEVGWLVLGVIWSLALLGVLYELFFCGRFIVVPTLVYLAMGWLAVFLAKPLLQHLPAGAVAWLLAGGLTYSAGVFFYLQKRLPHQHAIWHLFVMGGSTCHFLAVLLYVAPHPAAG